MSEDPHHTDAYGDDMRAEFEREIDRVVTERDLALLDNARLRQALHEVMEVVRAISRVASDAVDALSIE